jgi:2-polyprenyl-3-methyl-5-hydroxy-6-metoxy-1,4-benzoquinol methylase
MSLSGPEYCHERLGDRFDEAVSQYDTRRRVEVLIDQFLTDEMLRDKQVLDVGCGLGFFSERLRERGADVLGCDIGPGLVERTRQRAGCPAVVADVMHLAEQFGENRFDIIVSSECIEHTPEPPEALKQMARVVKPGGYLSISTPNIMWAPVVKTATLLGLRPYDGYENFSTFGRIRRALAGEHVRIVREQGLHLFPFQLPLKPLSAWCDRHLQCLRPLMINLCVLARKSPNDE